jgi:hypothetical protein
VGQFFSTPKTFGLASKKFFGVVPAPLVTPPAAGLWVLSGLNQTQNFPQVATSTDLIHWRLEDVGFGSSDSPGAVNFLAGAFITYSPGGKISVRDPITSTWNLSANPIGAIIGMGSSSTRVVAFDSAGNSSYSDNGGTTWTQGNGVGGALAGLVSVSFGAGKFLALIDQADQVLAATSADGITWTVGAFVFSAGGPEFAVAFGNSTFVAIESASGGATNAWTSADGVTWTPVATANTPPNGFAPTALIFDGDNFMAGYVVTPGVEDGFAVSADGLTWALTPAPGFLPPLTCLASDGTTLYVASDFNGPPDVQSSPTSTWSGTNITQPLSGGTGAEVVGAAFGS